MKRLLRLVVSLTILGVLAARMDWPQIMATFRGLRWTHWWAAVGVFLATQVVSALRWRMLARPLGFTQSAPSFVGYYYVGMFFNLLLPTSIGGDAVRAVYLNAKSGRRSAAVLSVLLDRLSGLAVLLVVACVAAAICPIELPAWVELAVAGSAVCAAVGLFLLPMSSRLLARFYRLQNLATTFHSTLRLYRRDPNLLAGSTVLSIVVQIAGVAQVALLGQAVGIDAPLAVYGVAVPMVALLTLLPVSLSGMGVREAGMLLFLAPAGVPAGPAVAVAFLWFCVQTVGGVVGAGVYLFGRLPRPEVRHDGAVGNRPSEGRERQRRSAA
ncbi:MAG: lysylphosphatidylglycerol synthase transmembrane domain-containing protein [Gemmataceae bacterium]